VAVVYHGLNHRSIPAPTITSEAEAPGELVIAHIIDPAAVTQSEGFSISVGERRIELVGHDRKGLDHASWTLRDVIDRSEGAIPGFELRDWPTFVVRGAMKDISRDKVPQDFGLATFIGYRLLRTNQLQLYMEHTFAYAGHEEVWRDASPLTGEDLLMLKTACKTMEIEIVPNQNSFGHMERWLKHDAYAHLAEDAGRRLTLCPVDPGSIALMRDLYGQLLPNFSSKLFNIGCDETWELGEGRSRAECEKRGKGRVYLEYLLKLFEIVREHGKTPMFWGDIILKHPELIPELPKDVIALQWGYAADEPREADSRRFAEAGIPFYVCPGTSGWNSIIGRAEDLLPNLENATRLGLQYGASGFLMTDWGDNGHWQHWPISLLGLAAGAAAAWSGQAPSEAELTRGVSERIFGDKTGKSGAALLALEKAQSAAGVRVHNKSIAHILVQQPNDPLPIGLTASGLDAVIGRIDDALGLLKQAQPDKLEGGRVGEELRHGAALAKLACRLGMERVAAGGAVASIPAEKRRALRRELEGSIEEFRRLWLIRNRPGGLEDSCRRFGPLMNLL
jgi:hypothetical protein